MLQNIKGVALIAGALLVAAFLTGIAQALVNTETQYPLVLALAGIGFAILSLHDRR